MSVMRCHCGNTVDLDEREEDWDAEHECCARHIEDEQAEAEQTLQQQQMAAEEET